jgi:hypothetical protein
MVIFLMSNLILILFNFFWKNGKLSINFLLINFLNRVIFQLDLFKILISNNLSPLQSLTISIILTSPQINGHILQFINRYLLVKFLGRMKHVRDLILKTCNILKQINYKLRHSILPHNCFKLFKCDVVVLLFLSIFDVSRDEVLKNWIVEDVFVVVSRWVFATHLGLQFI